MKNYFKAIIEKYNIKQKDLCPILNRTQAAISNYMTGLRQPDFETFIILAKYLNISLDEIAELDESFIKIPKQNYEKIKNNINEIKELIKEE